MQNLDSFKCKCNSFTHPQQDSIYSYKHNPFLFEYDCEKNSINFSLPYGIDNNIPYPKVGDILFKMTVRVFIKEHDGYCSYFEGDESAGDNVHSRSENIAFYFQIPEKFKDKINDLIVNGELLETDDTQFLFKEWTYHSNCKGSGACNFYDTYEPIKIEYVEII